MTSFDHESNRTLGTPEPYKSLDCVPYVLFFLELYWQLDYSFANIAPEKIKHCPCLSPRGQLQAIPSASCSYGIRGVSRNPLSGTTSTLTFSQCMIAYNYPGHGAPFLSSWWPPQIRCPNNVQYDDDLVSPSLKRRNLYPKSLSNERTRPLIPSSLRMVI